MSILEEAGKRATSIHSAREIYVPNADVDSDLDAHFCLHCNTYPVASFDWIHLLIQMEMAANV